MDHKADRSHKDFFAIMMMISMAMLNLALF